MKSAPLYDAVDVAAIPAGATRVAGYVDGRYVTFEEVCRRFPDAEVKVAITVTGHTLNAHVADGEKGDLTPDELADWALRKALAKQAPTGYCSLSPWPQYKAAVDRLFARHHLDPKLVSWWIADYNDDPKIFRGAVAHQHTTGHYDISSCRTTWPGVIPAPLSRRARHAAKVLNRHLQARRTPVARHDGYGVLLGVETQLIRVVKLEKVGR